jgi:hypothetical protein
MQVEEYKEGEELKRLEIKGKKKSDETSAE